MYTNAPLQVFLCAFRGYFKSRPKKNNFMEREKLFMKKVQRLSLTNDWFSPKIPVWLSIFDEYRFGDKLKFSVLEIGSWEGLSSYFILDNLPNANIT